MSIAMTAMPQARAVLQSKTYRFMLYVLLVAMMSDNQFGLKGVKASDTIASGQCFANTNQLFNSSNGQFILKLQSDGNDVLYSLPYPLFVFGSFRSSQMCMLTSGNLVVYNASNAIIWQSNTSGNAGAYAQM
jgi:hypothetical protein